MNKRIRKKRMRATYKAWRGRSAAHFEHRDFIERVMRRMISDMIADRLNVLMLSPEVSGNAAKYPTNGDTMPTQITEEMYWFPDYPE